MAACVLAAVSLTSSVAHAAEGMPQLDFANPLTLSQVVWMGIIFIILYFAVGRWGLPRVAEILDIRAATIGSNLDAARRAKQEADAAVAELTEATRTAQAQAQAEIAGAVAQAKQEAAAQAGVLNARLDAQIRSAEERIAVARNAAMGALRQVASEAAVEVVSRLTGLAADPALVDRAVGSALAARGQA
jgi:F-type H+-transporting ATPase subunit b